MPRTILSALVVIVAMFSSWISGCAELEQSGLAGDLFQTVPSAPGAALDEQTIAAGLKDALRIGAERTVASTSRTDGFFGNSLIRIAVPDQLQTMARSLRAVGFGHEVDSFEVAMNRAAERAAAEAKPVFWNAVSEMTLSDAAGILNGEQTAATDYFRSRTSDALRTRFRPIVSEKMKAVGLYTMYNQLLASYTALPLVTKPAMDLDSYITQKSLDGLFTVLGQEETRIRRDPVARSTALLQQVFGR